MRCLRLFSVDAVAKIAGPRIGHDAATAETILRRDAPWLERHRSLLMSEKSHALFYNVLDTATLAESTNTHAHVTNTREVRIPLG